MVNVLYYITCTIPEATNPGYEKEYMTSSYEDFWFAHEEYWKICIAMQTLRIRPCTVRLMYYDIYTGERDVRSEYLLLAPIK